VRWLALIAALSSAGCGDDGPTGLDPDDAPVVAVDRFGSFGQIHSRDSDPSLPGPGEPVDFAAMTTRGLGPDGQKVQYYNFDVQSRVPMVAYQLVLPSGVPVAGQLPIIDAVPGDDGYTDFWRIDRVTVSTDYVANSVTSADEVVASGWPIAEGEAIVNWPVVPDGSTAPVRIDGGDASTSRAWYRSQVAPYFRFDEHPLAPVPLGLFEGQVPLSYIWVSFNVNPGEDGGGLPSGFKTEPGTDQTHNVIATVPGDDDYSPLWMVNVYDNAEFDQVSDRDSAFNATLLATPPGEVNCPVMTIE
jgi:hypothetical protein